MVETKPNSNMPPELGEHLLQHSQEFNITPQELE